MGEPDVSSRLAQGRKAATMAVTMSDVAALAGVSIKTVSNVINDYPFIRDETKARVIAAIAELDYQPNLSARSLRSGRSGVIGLAVPNLSHAYFGRLADEVIQAAELLGLVVLVEQTNGSRDRELELLRSRRMRVTDGLILSPIGLRDEDAPQLLIDSPVVLLGERIFGGPVDHVVIQNAEAAAAAVEHLISKGRRRIVALGLHASGPNSSTLRLDGYRKALSEAGIEFDETLVARTDAGNSSQSSQSSRSSEAGQLWTRWTGAAAMRNLLDSGVKFDGLFAMNDELAFGALRVLQDRGIHVPDDVSVIGFDDVDEAQYSIPSLSTVDPGHREIAQTAVRVLAERSEWGANGGPPARELPSKFSVIERESTGD
jgi:DNA-binding LacI/PurR family transcriptional regulator